MALKFMFVVSCLSLLQASEAVKLVVRQESPPLNRSCTAQEELVSMDALPQNCRVTLANAVDFTNVLSILNLASLDDLMQFMTLCSETCMPSVLEHAEGCYGTNNGLVEFFRGACGTNMDGMLCNQVVYNSLTNFTFSWQIPVISECYSNFTLFADTTPTPICSDGCREGLRRFNNELGCCLNNIYNNSFVGEYLPFAAYSLWSNCGLESESPGFCSSAVALSTGIYSLLTLITLGTVFL